MQEVSWEQAEEMFELFCIWQFKPEMRWFEYVWKKFSAFGLTRYADQNEKQLVLIRLVTVGVLYSEFCQKAFDEYCDVESLYGEIYHCDDGFDPVRLGTMVQHDDIDPDSEPMAAFCDAIRALVHQQHPAVYDHLVKAFTYPTTLFVSLWLSMAEDIPVGDYQDDLYDEVVNDDVTGNKLDAFQYVENGMYA